ncbi:MAG: preprotein translocase subunit SecA, partial [Parcubacteria group bacterium]|nr:preprotein translocase subunit SecA [Parcubacteria group bacterium]
MSVGCIAHDSSFLYDPKHIENPKSEILNPKQVSNFDIRASNLDAQRDTLGAFKVVHEFLRPCSRKEAYAADITYGTNNEFGFDYLRDNMAYLEEQMSQRGHNFAIVDEIDSILIDEARTPLIISAPDEESAELYKTFAKITPSLKENVDYKIDEKMKAATITEDGIEKVERLLGVSDIYSEKGIKYVHQLEQALRAKALFLRDRDYVVKGGEVIIVDEFTGRLMPGRRWSEGLHQAIEAKEGVAIQRESRTLATITFQNYFRLYKKLAGMTGTAQTSAEEFHKVYNFEVVKIPTNK